MDFSAARARPAPAKPVQIMRIGKPSTRSPSPKNAGGKIERFEGGESLPDSPGGVDIGHPISPEEAEALQALGLDPEDIEHDEFDDVDERLWAEQQWAEQAEREEREQEEKQRQYELENFHTRDCPLPNCSKGVRVAKGGDAGDVLGIGMSMRAAVQLEQMLTAHLREHSLGEWIAALAELQDELDRRTTPMRPAPAPVTEGVYERTDVTPGPRQRDPARQAAVDAVDRRLGRQGAPPSPQEAADIDARLRARRAARRAKPPTPYELTPKFDGDPMGLANGVVTMKR